jgi:large subunit ribosomal protein L25
MAVELKSQARAKGTKAEIKALRASGKIPATVYGKSVEPVNVTVDADDMRVLLVQGNRNRLIQLDVPGLGVKTVFIKEIVREVIRRDIKHIDFLVLEAGEKLTYLVPVEPVGIPVGVKIGGGNMQLVTRFLKVRVPRENLVDKIEIDVSALEKEQAFFVKDIKFDAGTILTPARQAAVVVA